MSKVQEVASDVSKSTPKWLKVVVAAGAGIVSVGGAVKVVISYWSWIVGFLGLLTMTDARAQEVEQDKRLKTFVEERIEADRALLKQKLDTIHDDLGRQQKQLSEVIYLLMRRGGDERDDDRKPR